jgi:hypothetical protein
MKPKVAIPLALGGMFFGAAVTIANAEKRFDGNPYLLYVCLGVAAAMVVVAISGALIDVIRKPKDQTEQQRSAINIHLENIGNPTQAQSNKQSPPRPLLQPLPSPLQTFTTEEQKARVEALDHYQKEFLRNMIVANKRTAQVDAENALIQSLVTMRFLKFTARIIRVDWAGVMITDWAWDYLRKHPESLG